MKISLEIGLQTVRDSIFPGQIEIVTRGLLCLIRFSFSVIPFDLETYMSHLGSFSFSISSLNRPAAY